MREEPPWALSACGVVGFIPFAVATFDMLVSDNVEMPHVGLLIFDLTVTVALFVWSYLIGRKEY